MATYSSHSLIMGNWKLTVSAVSLEIFDFFSQICSLSSPPCCIRLLSKSLNLIVLRCNIKGKFSKNKTKFFFSETVKRIKLKNGTLALDIALYKNYDFYSVQIRTLVAMATYCFHRLIYGNFYCFIVDNILKHFRNAPLAKMFVPS